MDQRPPVDTLSVEEIFSQYSISEIRKLADDYSSKVSQASSQLYELVGSKYTDLIKIAEDIEQLYHQGRQIDTELGELVYKPSKFVSFTDSSLSKQNTDLRAKKAQRTRQDNKATVLRNIINNRLLKVDLLLAGGLRVWHTSQFIRHAKVFHTIREKFADVFSDEPSLKLWFDNLCDRYREYLITKISGYNALMPHQIASDVVKPSHFFSIDRLYLDHTYFDDDEDDSEDHDLHKESQVLFPNLDVYTSHSPPAVNYLVAFTILTAHESNADIGAEFIKFRHRFWEQTMVPITPNTNMHFIDVIKYVEATIEYFNMLYDETSNYRNVLNTTTKAWNASDFIGYKHWLDDELVNFNTEDIYPSPETKNINKFVDNLFKWVANLVTGEDSSIDAISQNTSVFAKFVLNYYQLKDYYSTFDSQSELEKVVDPSLRLNDVMTALTKAISSGFNLHCQQSYDKLTEIIKSRDSGEIAPGLFSSEMMQLMDENIDDYLATVKTITEEKTSPIAETVSKWTEDYQKFEAVTTINPDDGSLMSKVYYITGAQPLSSFTQKFVLSQITNIHDDAKQAFSERLAQVVQQLSEGMEDDLDTIYFYLDGIKAVKQQCMKLKIIQDAAKLDELLSKAFEKALAVISPSITVDYTKITDDDGVASGPSDAITQAVYSAAQNLACGSGSEMKYGYLFDDPASRQLLVLRKNPWVKSVLWKKVQSAQSAAVSPSQVYSDLVFLNLLAGADSKQDIEVELDESTSNYVITSVTHYLNASRNIILPLSNH